MQEVDFSFNVRGMESKYVYLVGIYKYLVEKTNINKRDDVEELVTHEMGINRNCAEIAKNLGKIQL